MDVLSNKTKSSKLPIPLPVERAIAKLGSDLGLARRRCHLTQASLAERIGASLSTVRRMEQGDLRVPLHCIARALHLFGEVERLANLLDTAQDDIGLTLMDERSCPSGFAPSKPRRRSRIPAM
jgi:DNA-binding XRE family transcriptional regulator